MASALSWSFFKEGDKGSETVVGVLRARRGDMCPASAALSSGNRALVLPLGRAVRSPKAGGPERLGNRQETPTGIVLGTMSTQVCPGASGMTVPLAVVNVVGLVTEGRCHVPVIS